MELLQEIARIVSTRDRREGLPSVNLSSNPLTSSLEDCQIILHCFRSATSYFGCHTLSKSCSAIAIGSHSGSCVQVVDTQRSHPARQKKRPLGRLFSASLFSLRVNSSMRVRTRTLEKEGWRVCICCKNGCQNPLVGISTDTGCFLSVTESE